MKRARVGCVVALEVDSVGPLAVELAGCERVERFGGTGPEACRAAVGFSRVAARRAARGVRFEIGRLVRRPFAVDVFRQSRGRRVLGNRRVFRATKRRGSFRWSARGRRVGDGIYVARVRMRLPGGRSDVRRLALVRRGGRFRVRAGYYRRRSCGLLSSFKLERPVFGGRANRALGIAFRLSREARVSVRVLRGKRTVKRFRTTTRRARRTHRLRLPSERLRRGDHRVVIRVTPVGGGPAVTARLVAKRL